MRIFSTVREWLLPGAVIVLMSAAFLGSALKASENTRGAPTLGNCSGAFAKSEEPRAFTAALAVGQMAYIKFVALPDDQRAAYEVRFKADRKEAMEPGAPDIIDECYRQIISE